MRGMGGGGGLKSGIFRYTETPRTENFRSRKTLTKIHKNFSTTYLLESILMCFFVCSGFLKRLSMPWHLASFITVQNFDATLARTYETHRLLSWQF